MGAWDIGSFDNDDASDWLYDLEESTDTSVIQAALDAVNESEEDSPEAPDCTCALAAAEIVAALRGYPLESLPENAQAWVDTHDGMEVSSLVKPALAAVERIRTNSELKDLWEDGGESDAAKWHATLDDLTARLKTR